MIVCLAGGVGAARFLDGLARVHPAEELFVLGNTGDDEVIHGLHISPDLDTVIYTLAGLANPKQGWGVRGDTYRCLKSLGALGEDVWFLLGDRDLATHLYRTNRLREGWKLSRTTREIASRLGVKSTISPMCEEPVRTMVKTPEGVLDFQTYFVRHRAQKQVAGLTFRGVAKAKPAQGVLTAIRGAAGIVFCPSNPLISVGPILAVPGIREAIRRRKAPCVAVSPIVGGKALKGPAAEMMRGLGHEVSALGVARLYRGLVDTLVIDNEDASLADAIEQLGIRAVVTNTIMTDASAKKALARVVLRSMEAPR